MIRRVRGLDGREWIVRNEMDWRQPAISDDFEHDVSASPTSAFILLGLIIVLGVVLVSTISDDVVAPWSGQMLWLGLLIVLTVLFCPARWALRRPWTVVAETGDTGDGQPVERWTGTVRGPMAARQQVIKVTKAIRMDSQPGIEGPLQPVA